MLDQGQTVITRPKTPTVPLTNHSPERFVPRTYTKAEATLLESMMIRLIPTDPAHRKNVDGCNLPVIRSAENNYRGPDAGWDDPRYAQGKVIHLMRDGVVRTAREVAKALDIDHRQASNALSNLHTRHGVVRRMGYRKGIVTWQATQ